MKLQETSQEARHQEEVLASVRKSLCALFRLLDSRIEVGVARALLSVAGLASITDREEEASVRAAILDAVAPYRTADAGYRLENEFHFLIASA